MKKTNKKLNNNFKKLTLTKQKMKFLLTIIIITFSLIGILLSLNIYLFKEDNLVVDTMIDNHDYIFNVNKMSNSDNQLIPLQTDDIQTIKENTSSILNNVYTLENINFNFGKNNEQNDLYPSIISKYLEFVEVKDNRLLNKIIGNIPKQNDEIVVHKFFVDYCMKYGIKKNNDTLFFPKNYQEVIGLKVNLGNTQVTIVGIIDDDNILFEQNKNKEDVENEYLRKYLLGGYIKKGYQIFTKGLVDKINDDVVKNDKPLKKLIGVKIYNDDKNNLSKTFKKLIYKNTTNQITKGNHYIYSSDNNYAVLGCIVEIYHKYSNYSLIFLILLIILLFIILYNFINKTLKTKDNLKISCYLLILDGVVSFLTIVIWFILSYILKKILLSKYYYLINLIPLKNLVITLIIFVFISLIVYILKPKMPTKK